MTLRMIRSHTLHERSWLMWGISAADLVAKTAKKHDFVYIQEMFQHNLSLVHNSNDDFGCLFEVFARFEYLCRD